MSIQLLHDAIAAVAPIDGVAVGIPTDKTTWRIDFQTSATDEQKQAAAAVVAAFDPNAAPAPVLSYLQFRALFTAAENAAIMTAAQANHVIMDWILQAVGAQIDFSNPTVKAGLDALVAAGLITADREAAIFANQPPPV
jgi:hypothetical protein